MRSAIFLLIFVYVYQLPVTAQIRLPRLVRDSMVLQRDHEINIWGWASPGEKISIRFENQKVRTRASASGKWMTKLLPVKAGGPYSMTLAGKNKITLNEILVGDVWLCAGQSNMVHQMSLHSVRYSAEIAAANFPQIRHFKIPNVTSLQNVQEDIPGGSWKTATAGNIEDFSAVAYFFALPIYQKYHVPIGLINASWGGTPVEAWTSEEGLKDFPSMQETIRKNRDSAYVNRINRAAAIANRSPADNDEGKRGSWFDPKYIPKGWQKITVPGYWEDQGIKDLNGVVWYRKEINLPASFAGKAAKVFLGRIVDADQLFINGQSVGITTYMYPQRRYAIADGILKTGKNIFVVRVTNNSGKGGFVPDKPYQVISGSDTIELGGEWEYKVGQVFPVTAAPAPSIAAANQPAAIYCAMVAPIINYSIKGVCWYQGETNADNPTAYNLLMPAIIHDWRQKFSSAALPFLYVQLPNFMEVNYLPSVSNWAATREAQLNALSIPHTGMAITIDVGEWNDIHPDRKKEVGERLALLARKMVYGDSGLVASGPIFRSAEINSGQIVISFDHVGGGLIAHDGESPGSFAIAGADKKFVWAKTKIEGDKVVVWQEGITSPMYVRYAWADNPPNANLYNKEGLPASPFRTDK